MISVKKKRNELLVKKTLVTTGIENWNSFNFAYRCNQTKMNRFIYSI